MSSVLNRQLFKKSHLQHRKRTIKQKRKQLSLINHSHFQISSTRFSSYTVIELEPICQQIAMEQISSSSSTRSNITCPLICLFCEDLIYEPITLYCGHTYCEQCVKDDEFSSVHCRRCSIDIQEQIQSPIVYARENFFSKNHFLQEIFERIETLKFKCENILLCHQAQNYYANEDYQKAIDVYSNILEKCNNI